MHLWHQGAHGLQRQHERSACRQRQPHRNTAFVGTAVYSWDELPAGEVERAVQDGHVAVDQLQARDHNRLGKSRGFRFVRHLDIRPRTCRRPKYDDCLNQRQLQPERLSQRHRNCAQSAIAIRHGSAG